MPSSNIKYQISDIGSPRVAIVHDWLYGGGAELVVLELHKMFPDAPIYTSYCSDDWRKKLDNKVVTGYLQHPPFKQLRKFLPLLRQWWFASIDLKDFDLVISSTGNGEAKFVKVPNGKHISYCHSPVHFYWRHYDEYIKNPGFRPKWLARLGLKLMVKPLRERDYAAAQKVDYFIANSSHIQNDINQYYDRDSVVIHPPVNINRFKDVKPSGKGFITHGRLVPMKRVDLIIQAFNELALPLTVIGSGPEMDSLKKLAGPTVELKGYVPNDQLNELFAQHSGYIFASFEDFGISPVEAMAAGLPVLAYRAGGALDYVDPGKTGEFFDEQSLESIKEAIQNFNSKKYKPEVTKKKAEEFSTQNFQKKLKELLKAN